MLLDENTEWQNAINFTDRHNARCRHECRLKELKRKKLINRAVDFALVGACAVALETIGLLNIYISFAIAAVSMVACSFTCGRIRERMGGFAK